MLEATPQPAPRTPAPKATLKDRVERDRLADLAEPGFGTGRISALIAAAKEKAARPI